MSMAISMPEAESRTFNNPLRTDFDPEFPLRHVSPDGRLREKASDADRTMTALAHLWLLAAMIVGPLCLVAPLVLWLIRREKSPFVDDHGREIVNAQISMVVITAISLLTLIGWIIVVPIYVVAMIRGCLAASRGEYFRYPITIRFLT